MKLFLKLRVGHIVKKNSGDFYIYHFSYHKIEKHQVTEPRDQGIFFLIFVLIRGTERVKTCLPKNTKFFNKTIIKNELLNNNTNIQTENIFSA